MSQKPQDDWMERWLPQLQSAGSTLPVLELGCDTGIDTRWLLRHGFEVVATDLTLDAIGSSEPPVVGATLLQHDLRQPMPFDDASLGAVVASLCLHYFDWRTTVAAVAQIHRCLAPGGLLLCRLNSVRDVLHGAGQGEEVEPGLFRQAGHYASLKRFFDRQDLDRLFDAQPWSPLSIEERSVLRYKEAKVAWELVLRRT